MHLTNANSRRGNDAAHRSSALGLDTALSAALRHSHLHIELPAPKLIEKALTRGEGVLASNGALAVTTGSRTGRSPRDRFIVRDEGTADTVDWGTINHPMSSADFERLWLRACAALKGRELFVSELRAGASPEHSLHLLAVTEQAWHNLFLRQMLITPSPDETAPPNWTLLNLPSLATDPATDGTASEAALIIDFTGQRILILGLHYAGEMKKAVFSVLNHLLPEAGVLSMHCAANVGESGDVSLFFGLSGTGKTTLSADPDRFLIGDDEHGWDETGIFNLEGGCYAKCINLSPEREPVIHQAIRFGSVMENVVLDPATHSPRYDDANLTENTRVAYPRDFIAQRMPGNRGGHPDAVIFLTCDLYGVLPPVALLTPEQAAYHYLSGYTALVGSTEVGAADGVKPTFSACFGAPFFPRPARAYAALLVERLARHRIPVYLVNTGWNGGPYGGDGQRLSIATSRAIIHAIQRGELRDTATDELPHFGLRMPRRVSGVDPRILDPRETWNDGAAYDRTLKELAGLFAENFTGIGGPSELFVAGPHQ
jgi:phosphoenolpyruvate carboxykinase (ATP)